MSTVTARTGFGIDTRDFHDVAVALRKAAPTVSRNLRRNLREAGLIVAADAKKNAEQFSESIPPTIKVRTRGATVWVQAGGAAAQAQVARQMFSTGYGTPASDAAQKRLEKQAQGVVIAGLFELGNTGGSKSASASESGRFRHPVFGSDKWVDQPMHPFLAPAAEKNAAVIEERVVGALDEATRIIVFE